MKISFNWLSDYIDLKKFRDNMEELSHILTQAGLEVEGIENQKEQFNHVVIGRLKSVDKHPDADKLTVCQVDVGEPVTKQIVCGAKNHKMGDYVVVAQPGAVLPGDFKIKKSKIRGVESLGMLCSEKELGLSDESEGIIATEDGKIGVDFSTAYGLNDVIFELNVTPNRADCLSHIGLAQELSALLDLPYFKPKTKFKAGRMKTTQESQVHLQDAELCPRYAGIRLSHVKVGPSPQWLRARLEAVGVNCINNVVDVTNYVLFEYGQPLHAFDWSQIKGGAITIRRAQEKEKFTTIDSVELELSGEELVIADDERAVALAGVVGGENSGVNEQTTDLFLEAAFFTAKGVRRTSRRFGFETDASYRFSRGVNPEQTLEAMKRACDLLVDVAGAEVACDWYDEYPEPLTKEPILVDVSYVAQRLGYAVEDRDFFDAMKRLGCTVKSNKVTPPAHRWDLSIPEDLVEEYGRLRGYDQLEEKLPALLQEPTTHEDSYWQERSLAEHLRGQGFFQSVNYAFLNKEYQEELIGPVQTLAEAGLSVSEPVVVKNPISEDFSTMRVSLMPSLMTNMLHNYRHGGMSGRLFEIAPTSFQKDGEYKQERRLAMALWLGKQELWASPAPSVYELKTALENILRAQVSGARWEWKEVPNPPEMFHPKQVVSLFWRGKMIGLVGTLHPTIKNKHKIRSNVAFAEISLDLLGLNQKTPSFKPVSSFPRVEKDLAFVMSKETPSVSIVKEIQRAGGALLRSVDVVDVFEGGNLGEDQKSISYRMVYQSDSKTLSDEDINKVFNKTIENVQSRLSVQLRQ